MPTPGASASDLRRGKLKKRRPSYVSQRPGESVGSPAPKSQREIKSSDLQKTKRLKLASVSPSLKRKGVVPSSPRRQTKPTLASPSIKREMAEPSPKRRKLLSKSPGVKRKLVHPSSQQRRKTKDFKVTSAPQIPKLATAAPSSQQREMKLTSATSGLRREIAESPQKRRKLPSKSPSANRENEDSSSQQRKAKRLRRPSASPMLNLGAVESSSKHSQVRSASPIIKREHAHPPLQQQCKAKCFGLTSTSQSHRATAVPSSQQRETKLASALPKRRKLPSLSPSHNSETAVLSLQQKLEKKATDASPKQRRSVSLVPPWVDKRKRSGKRRRISTTPVNRVVSLKSTASKQHHSGQQKPSNLTPSPHTREPKGSHPRSRGPLSRLGKPQQSRARSSSISSSRGQTLGRTDVRSSKKRAMEVPASLAPVSESPRSHRARGAGPSAPPAHTANRLRKSTSKSPSVASRSYQELRSSSAMARNGLSKKRHELMQSSRSSSSGKPNSEMKLKTPFVNGDDGIDRSGRARSISKGRRSSADGTKYNDIDEFIAEFTKSTEPITKPSSRPSRVRSPPAKRGGGLATKYHPGHHTAGVLDADKPQRNSDGRTSTHTPAASMPSLLHDVSAALQEQVMSVPFARGGCSRATQTPPSGVEFRAPLPTDKKESEEELSTSEDRYSRKRKLDANVQRTVFVTADGRKSEPTSSSGATPLDPGAVCSHPPTARVPLRAVPNDDDASESSSSSEDEDFATLFHPITSRLP